MDALMATLVAAFVLTATDRAALLVAAAPRADRQTGIALVIAAVMATGSTMLGIALAARLAPAAQLLMLAAALGLVGIEFLVRPLPGDAAGGGIVAAIAGSGLWFVVLTLTMRSALPWPAIPGAIGGVAGALVAAATAGNEWRRLPVAAVRRVVGALLAVLAAILACSAFGIA